MGRGSIVPLKAVGMVLQPKRHSRKRQRSIKLTAGDPALLKINQVQRERDELCNRLQLQFERMPVACIISDPKMRIIDWNPAAVRMFGYERDEVLDKDVLLVAPASRAFTQEINHRLAQGDMSAHAVGENVTKDGRTIICDWCNTPLRNAAGEVIAILAMAQDVTERHLSEERLKRSESLLADAQEIAHLGSWSWNIRSGRLTWSDELYRLFGLQRGASPPTHEDFLAALHPDDRARMTELIDAACRGTATYDCEFRIIRSDGQLRVIYSRGKVIRNKAGEATEMIGTGQDITERTDGEVKLRRSEAMLAEAQRVAHLGNWSRDLRSGELIWSDECYRIFGLRPQEFPMTFELFLGLLHPEDHGRVRTIVDRAVRERQSFEFHARVPLPDGAVRDVYVRGLVASDETTGPVRTFGIVQDLTERKRAEEALLRSERRLQLAADLVGLCHYEWDMAKGQPIWGARLKQMWGLPPDGYVDREILLSAIHPDDRPVVAAAHERAFDPNGDGQYAAEYRVIGIQDGVERWMTARGCTFFENGKAVEYLGTVMEITERKRLEREILEISERERLRIGQDLHDDLCQQLTGIAFTSRLLQQRLATQSPVDAAVAGEIMQAVQHATARARDLARGLHPVRLETDGLDAALRELATKIESVFRVSCRFRHRPGGNTAPILDSAITIQLYRIAQEAATNAVKHGEAKHISVTLGTVKGRMELSISDDGVGIGIAPKCQGMGLQIMHQRACAIGATLSITRRRQGGTLATCSLGHISPAPTNRRVKR